MRRPAKFMRLPLQEKFLLLNSLLLLLIVRLGLTLLSFKTLQRLLDDLKPDRGKQVDAGLPCDRIAWAVETAGRYVPRTTCLSKALCAHALLMRNGHESSLHIGVARDGAGKLEAHAWVVIQGQVVIGQMRDLSRYVPLASLNGTQI